MLAQFTPLEWLALVEHELLLFASVFFLLGAADELAIDLTWAWLKVTGRAKTWRGSADGRPKFTMVRRQLAAAAPRHCQPAAVREAELRPQPGGSGAALPPRPA